MRNEDEGKVRALFTSDMIDAVEGWFGSKNRGCGLCLLCGETIRSEADFIPDSNTHNCDAGRRLEGFQDLGAVGER